MYRCANLGQGSSIEADWLSSLFTGGAVLLGEPSVSATQTVAPSNLYGGYLSQDQKNQLVNEEAANLVTASGGTMSQNAAQTQAQSDITNVLTAAGADPSQNPASGVPWWLIAAGAGAVVLAIFALK